MAVIVPSVVEAVKIAGANASLATVGTAVAASTVGISFIAIAAVCMTLAVGSQFISSRHHYSSNFDSLEINALHTAKYLVQEIKKENACIQTYENPERSDKQTWVQATHNASPTQNQARGA